VAVRTVRQAAGGLELVRFVLFSDADLGVYLDALRH